MKDWRCPPGLLCLSNQWLILGFGFLLLLFYQFYRLMNLSSYTIPNIPNIPNISNVNYIPSQRDVRYDMAPMPVRYTPLPVINIPTQGIPDSFQSIGVLTMDDKVLPIYGRRTIGSRDRWNYYTRTDSYNPVPLPIHFQKRDCMDQVGCQEIMSGEYARVASLQKEGKVDIYSFSI
jgi:hypothetical protein